MDKLSKEQRHKNMAAIHSKDTKPEMIVRRGLWSRGFRYRLNHIWLQDRQTRVSAYPQQNEEDMQMISITCWMRIMPCWINYSNDILKTFQYGRRPSSVSRCRFLIKIFHRGIANQMEAPIDLKMGFNRHEKRLQRVKSKLFSLKPFNLS